MSTVIPQAHLSLPINQVVSFVKDSTIKGGHFAGKAAKFSGHYIGITAQKVAQYAFIFLSTATNYAYKGFIFTKEWSGSGYAIAKRWSFAGLSLAKNGAVAGFHSSKAFVKAHPGDLAMVGIGFLIGAIFTAILGELLQKDGRKQQK